MPLIFRSTFILALSFCVDAWAYESDQYMNRKQDVADSLLVLNQQVNQAIDKVLRRKRPPTTRKGIARGIWREIGGVYWADKIERWAAKSHLVDKYEQKRHNSIYRNMPIWATRVNFVFGVGRSFKLNGVMVGSDKFGHFFSQGYKYYRRELRGDSDSKLLARGAFAERWLFGHLTTGVYSNADLVANYEGWLFYQSLFLDDIVSDKSAILVWREGKYVKQRPFTWADHVNAYWDEALNPSFNVPSLNKRLRKSIVALCPEAREAPAHYLVMNDQFLWTRYQHIGLKDNRENQFEAICGL